MFKVTLLIASLAYASAGYAGLDHSYAAPVAAHYSSAPSVSYSTFSRSHAPSLGHGYAHAAPVLAAPTQVYSAPLTKAYTHGYNYAPALSYGQGYTPALSHNSYGYSEYAAPLTTKTVAITQPQVYQHNTYATQAAPVLAHHGYNYGGSHLLAYNNHHGHCDIFPDINCSSLLLNNICLYFNLQVYKSLNSTYIDLFSTQCLS